MRFCVFIPEIGGVHIKLICGHPQLISVDP
jgi:hypothetical protein